MKMRVWYDTEFLEQGREYPIELISIGMVRADGARLYMINGKANVNLISQHGWLRHNVLPHLPVREQDSGYWDWDPDNPDFKYVVWGSTLASAAADFLLKYGTPELWAWYGDYDHVVLAQIFGRMVDMPSGLPYYTNDLKQEVALHYGDRQLPSQHAASEHHALSDAEWVAIAGAEIGLWDLPPIGDLIQI